MPFDGSGNFTPSPSPNFPAIPNTPIASGYYNNVINDIAAGLTNALTRDGQGRPTANINWNAKNLTNVAAFESTTLSVITSATFGTNVNISIGQVSADNALLQGNGTDTYIRTTNAAGKTYLGVQNAQQAITIDASGNVGIGTASPTQEFELRKDQNEVTAARISNNNTGNLAQARLELSTGTSNSYVNLALVENSGSPYRLTGNGSGVVIAFDDSDTHYFRTNAGVIKATLTSAGDLSITGEAFSINTGKLFFQHNGSEGFIRTGTGNLYLGAANTNYFVVTTSGALQEVSTGYQLGYKDLPQKANTTAYTLVLTDRGKHIYATAASYNITIPTDAAVSFPLGTCITIVVEDASKTLVPDTGVTLVWAGVGTTGNRTLLQYAVCTLIKVGTNRWFVSGSGLS